MTDAGFFKGTSADQDSRFSDKNKKLMKTMKFADNLEKKIDMKKIQLELMKPFITGKLNAMMPIEDDVIIEYVYSQLEESQFPDGKSMQIMMTGFLGKTKAKAFIGELWNLLLEAQNSPHGIPKEMIEMKRNEMVKKKEEEQRINASLIKGKDDIERSLSMRDRQAAQSRKEYQSVLQRLSPPSSRDRRSSRERRDVRRKSISPPVPVKRKSISPPPAKRSSYRHENDDKDNDSRRKESRRFSEKPPENKALKETNNKPAEKTSSKHRQDDSLEKSKSRSTRTESNNSKEVKKARRSKTKSKSSSRSSSSSSSGSSSDSSASGSSRSSSSSSGTSSSGSGSSSSDGEGSSSSSSVSSLKKKESKRKHENSSLDVISRSSNQPTNTLTEKSDEKKNMGILKANGIINHMCNSEMGPLQRIIQAEKSKNEDRNKSRKESINMDRERERERERYREKERDRERERCSEKERNREKESKQRGSRDYRDRDGNSSKLSDFKSRHENNSSSSYKKRDDDKHKNDHNHSKKNG